VNVNNKQEDLVIKAAAAVLEEEGYDDEAEVSIVFVDNPRIQALNKQYRGVDNPTDVLSFSMQEGENIPGEDNLLGDVVISLETALHQAKEFGHSVERETAYLAVHGVLHLLGYDHIEEADRKQMREKEESIMQKINLPR
jgi:probable rRNA maturation factor